MILPHKNFQSGSTSGKCEMNRFKLCNNVGDNLTNSIWGGLTNGLVNLA